MKTFALIVAIVSLLLTVPTVSAKGLNCKGSMWCNGAPISGGLSPKIAIKIHSITLKDYINTLPDDTWIPNNWLIGCTRTVCAYLSNVIGGGLYAAEVKEMAQDIVDHGCERCGKRARDWTEDEKGAGLGNRIWYSGYLEFNYVGTKRRTGHQGGDGDGHCGAQLNGLCPDFCKLVQGCVIPMNPKPDWTLPPNKRGVDEEQRLGEVGVDADLVGINGTIY